MLVKEIASNNVKKLLTYIKRGASVTDNFCYYHNLPAGTSIDEMTSHFDHNASFAKRVKNKAMHVVLSFHKDSTPYLDDATLYKLTAEFVRLRAPEAMGFFQKHVDKEHLHIHGCLSGNLLYQDRSILLKKKEYLSKVKELEIYQQTHFENLDASLVYNRVKEKKRELSPRQTQKKEVIDLLEKLAEKARNMDDFFELIEAHKELDLYSYRNRTNGVFYKGKKYRFKTHIPERYNVLEQLQQLQRWNELSKGDGRIHEIER